MALHHISALRCLYVVTLGTAGLAEIVAGRFVGYALLEGRLIALARIVEAFGPTTSHQSLRLILERLTHIDHTSEGTSSL